MSLAPDPPVFWLDAGAAEGAMETLVPQLQALALVASELDARLLGAGLGGIDEAVSLHTRLRTVLDGFTAADLDRMARQVEEAKRALEAIVRHLNELKTLKDLVERVEPPA
jgi:hypothetical protein